MSLFNSHFEIILAAGTFIWAIASFLFSRKKELAWKKTEFIVQQSEFLDTDQDMREITLILYIYCLDYYTPLPEYNPYSR